MAHAIGDPSPTRRREPGDGGDVVDGDPVIVADPGRRRSRFSDDVDPELPHPEHPRPQLRRPAWTNLNGWWDLAILPADAAMPSHFPTQVLVPFPVGSALSGVDHTLRPEERAWMRRRFECDPADVDGRLRLHFGAVDWECRVWCNGTEVGRHRGGHTPFHVDVTDALVTTGAQEIVVSVWDPTDEGPQPVGKQSLTPGFIWYPPVAGIWQTVWLEPVPDACVESVVAVSSLVDERVTVTVAVSGTAPGDRVRITASADGADVGSLEVGMAGDVGRGDLHIADLRPWSPEDPFLHDLVVHLVRNGTVVDSVTSYFGAREVAVAPDEKGVPRLMLNGEPRFHLGLLDQGWWPDGLYTAPTDAALASDIEAALDMGFNMIRKHVKVEPARWYWHADRLGALVWQDMPSTRVDIAEMGRQIVDGVAPPDMDWSVVGPADDPAGFRAELDAMIDTLAGHPSIVVWVPFNEGWGQHDTAATLAHVAERDPSRLVDGPSGWVDAGEGHIRDHHMYLTESEFPGVDPERATVYGEFGGYTLAVEGHRVTDDSFGYKETATDRELIEAYTALMGEMAALVDRGLAGAIYTQATDVEGEINGLLTYDRLVQKIPSGELRRLHAALTEPGRPGRRARAR